MTLAVLNYSAPNLVIFNDLDQMDHEEQVDFLHDQGFNLDEIEWIVVDKDLEIEYR